MDTFQQMRVFCKVAEKQSFVKTAKASGLSTAAVSKMIFALEERLATRLLHRTTRKVSLTDAGRAYFERCLGIINDVDETEAELSQAATNPAGRLRIGAPTSFGIVFLGEILAEFVKKYPKVAIELSMWDRKMDPIEEGYDLTLRIAQQLPESSLVATKITSFARVTCASPAYVKQWGKPQSPQDLKEHNCLYYSLADRPGVWTYFKNQVSMDVKISGSLVSNNSIVIRDAILKGVGIAQISEYLVKKEIKSGKLVSLLDSYQEPALTLYAIYPHHLYLSKKVRVLIDFLKSYFS
jgi:DNA-binding transcriptional LysR family regulator